jgi:malate dehydrogenase (oxaloacetate-decarboxylating)(NADP+)
MFDSVGLVVRSRDNLAPHKLAYAHDHPRINEFLAAVQRLKPTGIIGASGQPRSFTRPIVEQMCELNERPIVFSLSNPTANAECTAEEAYTWSRGRAIFASGSPFAPVTLEGQTYVPGQGNNAYIFPGVGLGVVLSEARHVTDEMFLAAAQTLANQVTYRELDRGQLYPPLSELRKTSAAIAVAVIEVAQRQELARKTLPDDLLSYVTEKMFVPRYKRYV